jgi:phosphonate transport system substrate-binding protein
MKGKIFAFVDEATTAGHLLPLAFFKENGIDNYRTYFKETYFAGTHENAVYDVLDKRADIGSAKNTVYDYLTKSDKRIKEELIVLKRSPDVPQNSLAVRRELDKTLKNHLKTCLLDMHNNTDGQAVLKAFGAIKFIETIDSDYIGVYQYANEIGLDLSTYDYVND